MALVFMDLDGTLLDQGRPAKNIKETVKKLMDNGHIAVIATGRAPHLLKAISE
ncbi:MAG: HAD hydrolase family protein, partial [Bacilli bacterium]|nr:HAD hydrolase family protein [Bacilli bacterium]